jgi:hypothetical protein
MKTLLMLLFLGILNITYSQNIIDSGHKNNVSFVNAIPDSSLIIMDTIVYP